MRRRFVLRKQQPANVAAHASDSCAAVPTTRAGWDHRETIASLVRKAGFAGAVDKALLESITLTRYQSSKAKATYAEFQAAAGVR